MTDPTLTPFQFEAERAALAIVEQSGRKIDQREILHGVVPVLSRSPVTIVRLTAGDTTCWIDDDDISFRVSEKDGRFERADYASAGEFLADFLKHFREALTADMRIS